MKKQHLFEYRLFSAIFDTQQSKDDVIGVMVTSFWICHSDVILDLLLLFLRDFVPYYYHAKFGGDWITNNGEMECAPSQPIWFQNTRAWIGLIFDVLKIEMKLSPLFDF